MHTTHHLHYENFDQYSQSLPLEKRLYLDARQEELLRYIRETKNDSAMSTEENEWLVRSYPVLAILAPVMSTDEEKIEFRAIR